MSLRLLIIVALFGLACSALGADVQPIFATFVENSHVARHIEPILDANRQIAGFVLSDTSKSLRLVWLDGRPEDTIPLTAWPHKTINYLAGDTLIVYAFVETSEDVSSFGTWPKLARLSWLNGQRTEYVVTPRLYWGVDPFEYMSSSSEYEGLRFLLDEESNPAGIIFEDRVYYHGYILTIGTHDGVAGTGVVYSLDLSTVLLRRPFGRIFLGQFTSSDSTEYLCSNEPYYYFWDFDNMEYPSVSSSSSIAILDSNGAKLFEASRDWTDTWNLFSGDFTSSYPNDEVVLYGSRPILDSTHLTTPYLACYNFSTGQPFELWYHDLSREQSFNGLTLQYYYSRENSILATRGSKALFLNTRTGILGDSANIGKTLSHTTFLQIGQGGQLALTGQVGDSLFAFQFDAITDIPENGPLTPSSFTLSQNYPNPFNATTEIRFSLARTTEVTLTIYNLLGQEVKTLIAGKIPAGEHRVSWNGRDNQGAVCATGLYLYQVQIDNQSESRKMLLLK